MKKVIKLVLGMLLLSFVLISCNKKDEDINDEDKPSGNYFKIDNTEYQLSAGILDNYGTDDSLEWYYGYAHYVFLYSSGFSIVEFTQDPDWDIEGKGNAFFIDLYSTNGLTLDNGTYTYSNAEPSPVGTFDNAICVTDFDAAIDDGSQENKSFNLATGELKVSKTNNNYTITINGTTENGKTVTGYYKGSLRYFDFSGNDKKSTSLPGFYPKGANLL